MDVTKFIESQKSLHLYKKAQEAFINVLSTLLKDDFEAVTKNLIILAMHEGATGQVMHFAPKNEDFAILQLSIPKNIPMHILEGVIAHELGHVMQGRNWETSDGDNLEVEADDWAKKWGYPVTKSDLKWLESKRTIPPKGSRY